MNTEEQKRIILDYLEHTYTGAKMMGDEEIKLRLVRAITAFEADIYEDYNPDYNSDEG